MGGAPGAAVLAARDPLTRSATNSTASDHASHTIAHVHTAHGAVVPNVAAAMLCASDAPAT